MKEAPAAPVTIQILCPNIMRMKPTSVFVLSDKIMVRKRMMRMN